MGKDPSLSSHHPSIIIHGQKYHYGREPEYGQYLVENATYAKDYWVFDAREDLEAFLVNLPESANHKQRISAAYPDWDTVSHEQRDVYLAEDRANQRALAEAKRHAGTAASYNMDLEGERGPHEPQRIQATDQKSPLERVEGRLGALKADGWTGYNDPLKLRLLEGEIDWSGVAPRDKEAILKREVNFAAITPDQFEFVFQDIRFDKREPADETVARRLFEGAHPPRSEPQLRDTTRNLVEAVLFDMWPRSAAIIDFGLNSQRHYEALHYAIREGEITPEQLDAALGNGSELTALVRSAPSNPHRDVTFRTDWDEILRRPDRSAVNQGKARPPSPGEIARGDDPSPTNQTQDLGNERGRKR